MFSKDPSLYFFLSLNSMFIYPFILSFHTHFRMSTQYQTLCYKLKNKDEQWSLPLSSKTIWGGVSYKQIECCVITPGRVIGRAWDR